LLYYGQQLGTGFSKKCPAVKILEQFGQKDNSHLLGVFHICLPGVLKVHFGFAVYKVSELDQTINSLVWCVLPWPKFANQGAQNLHDVHAKVSLSCKPYSSICTLWWSRSSLLFYRLPLCLLFGIQEE